MFSQNFEMLVTDRYENIEDRRTEYCHKRALPQSFSGNVLKYLKQLF